MARPPAARAKALHAFARIVIDQGERAATLDAVAAAAGISKGGLLYHFGSKDALVDGLLEQLTGLITDDVAASRAHPAGPTDHILRTSMVDHHGDFELFYLAATRLSQGSYPRAVAVLQHANELWTAAVEEEVLDHAVAKFVVLLSDGIYANAAFGTDNRIDVDEVITLVRQLVAARAVHTDP